MDPRRFDALARTLTTGASRRRILQFLPGLAVGGLLGGAQAARALDAGDVLACPTPVGGRACTGGADCLAGEICLNGVCQVSAAAGAQTGDALPADQTAAVGQGETGAAEAAVPTATPDGGAVEAPGNGVGTGQEATATPRTIGTPAADAAPTPTPATAVAAQLSPNQTLAVQLHEGVCGSLDATPAFPLIDIGAAAAGATPVTAGAADGQPTAIPARFSSTAVDVDLTTLLEAPYAVDVRLDADDPGTSVACGDVGAPAEVPRPENQLAIGLAERNGSGLSGVAWLSDEGERTVVYVFVAQGLSGAAPASTEVDATDETAAGDLAAPAFAAGLGVVTTEEVNLRTAPSTEAAVVAVLPAGQPLTVTAAPVDGWVPVRDPATDQPGYVNAEFLALED